MYHIGSLALGDVTRIIPDPPNCLRGNDEAGVKGNLGRNLFHFIYDACRIPERWRIADGVECVLPFLSVLLTDSTCER